MEFKEDPRWKEAKEACGDRGHWGEFFGVRKGALPIAVMNCRWDQPVDWTERDSALVDWAYDKLVGIIWPHRFNIRLIYAICLEWAEANPAYEVYLGGERIQ